MREEVEITAEIQGTNLNIGDTGVITGYTKGKNNFGKATVLINGLEYTVPIYCIKPINETK